ncbi:MAG: SDR family NAD(P)-dependent oxidoreductase [Actinomycetota bacterium]|nr:SDR family NAD(P)-dependent oxidoreductase [Actinomycetota bacterium]
MTRVAIVTGANSGIGFEMARELLRRGYRVAAFDLALANGDRLRGSSADVLLVPCDVRREEAVAEAVEAVVRRWGRVDVLVNNAAIAPFGSVGTGEADVASIQASFDVNVFGPLRTIAAVLPVMKAQGEGTIANVASVLGFTGFPRLAGYSSTKGAMEALTRSLALDLARFGITVQLLHAPLTRTPASKPLDVPDFVMADPLKVARSFASGIESRRPLVAADARTTAWLLAARLAPGLTGKLQARFVEWYGARKTARAPRP